MSALIEAASREVLERGIRILQGVRFAPTDAGHVAKLLDAMAPPHGARIADMGCGFGEVARLMREIRPDLYFNLVNNSEFQLSQAPFDPRGTEKILCDMTDTPLANRSVDAIMFLYSLCHVDLGAALAEARRLARPGAVLFLFDYLRLDGDNELAEQTLAAHFHRFGDLLAMMELHGWGGHVVRIPADGDDSLFRSLFEDQGLYNAIFATLRPMTWRAVAK